MNFYDTGRVIIGCKHNPANMPTVDAGWQQIILKMNENKAPQAAPSGFFNDHSDLYPMPTHIAGMAAYRRNNGEGMEA